MAPKAPLKAPESWGDKNPGKVRCPFVWSDGRKCEGHITEVHELEPKKVWSIADGKWRFSGAAHPRESGASKFHAICSSHGVHGGASGFRQNGVIVDIDGLPNELAQEIEWARHKSLPGGWS